MTAWKRPLSFALLLCAVLAMPTAARALDPHEVYERRCARCHENHAGDFVANGLEVRDGRVVGRKTGIEIETFLAGGHGRLEGPELPAVVAHLRSIFDSGGLFRERCRVCHEPAVTLARRELALRDGRVVGRYSGRDIRTFMESHGRVEGAEIDVIMRMLERQLKTAN